MDVPFKVAFSRNTLSYRCACFALFKKLCPDTQSLQLAVNKLMGLWRMRTADLIKRGTFEHNPIRVQYCRNCPPSVGNPSSSLRQANTCKFYACPWCWNRMYCITIYKKLSKVLSADKNLKIYSYQLSNKYDITQYKNSNEHLKTNSKQSSVIINRLRRRTCVKGGAALHYFQPAVDGFEIITKLIVVASKPVELNHPFVFKFISRNPVKIASYFGSYPYYLIKRGISSKGLALFVRSLNRGTRRLIKFGVFINKRGNNDLRRPQPRRPDDDI